MSSTMTSTTRLVLQLFVATIFAAVTIAAHAENSKPVSTDAVALSEPIGQQRFLESAYREPYWSLINYFETQMNQAYCSVASSVIALNALGLPRPYTRQYPDYPLFTQTSFFDKVDPKIVDSDAVSHTGLTMDQLTAVLKTYPLSVQTKFASDVSLEEFRTILKNNLRLSDHVVLLNFDRKSIKEQGSGHWSPIAAYHVASDSVLVLDVARYKYPPLWIPLPEIYSAAQSIDGTSGKSRGLLILQKK